jgi:hypothetical protein
MYAYARLDTSGNITSLSLNAAQQQWGAEWTELAADDPRIAAFQAASVPPPVLDAATLAAALIAKGTLKQSDIDAAVQIKAGASVATAVAAVPMQPVAPQQG